MEPREGQGKCDLLLTILVAEDQHEAHLGRGARPGHRRGARRRPQGVLERQRGGEDGPHPDLLLQAHGGGPTGKAAAVPGWPPEVVKREFERHATPPGAEAGQQLELKANVESAAPREAREVCEKHTQRRQAAPRHRPRRAGQPGTDAGYATIERRQCFMLGAQAAATPHPEDPRLAAPAQEAPAAGLEQQILRVLLAEGPQTLPLGPAGREGHAQPGRVAQPGRHREYGARHARLRLHHRKYLPSNEAVPQEREGHRRLQQRLDGDHPLLGRRASHRHRQSARCHHQRIEPEAPALLGLRAHGRGRRVSKSDQGAPAGLPRPPPRLLAHCAPRVPPGASRKRRAHRHLPRRLHGQVRQGAEDGNQLQASRLSVRERAQDHLPGLLRQGAPAISLAQVGPGPGQRGGEASSPPAAGAAGECPASHQGRCRRRGHQKGAGNPQKPERTRDRRA